MSQKTTVTFKMRTKFKEGTSVFEKIREYISHFESIGAEAKMWCNENPETGRIQFNEEEDRYHTKSFICESFEEFLNKYGTHISYYDIIRAMADYGEIESLEAKTETINEE